MTNQPKATNRVDELLDELLADDHSPEAVTLLTGRSAGNKKPHD